MTKDLINEDNQMIIEGSAQENKNYVKDENGQSIDGKNKSKFIDLLDGDIQPAFIDGEEIPEIEISEGLRKEIHNMISSEEEKELEDTKVKNVARKKVVKVNEKSVAVKTQMNPSHPEILQYVFFPSQWYYLAVICKEYAMALKDYCYYFDTEIRGSFKENFKKYEDYCKNNGKKPDTKEKKKKATLIMKEIIDSLEWCPEDKEKMDKFIYGKKYENLTAKMEEKSNSTKNNFRPGDKVVSLQKNSDKNGCLLSTREIYSTCITNKIDVQANSSYYLGKLVYCLTRNKNIYDKLEEEVNKQLINVGYEGELLPTKSNADCARTIVGCIYDIDEFYKIEDLFTKIDDDSI
jgi:hypothetical protein